MGAMAAMLPMTCVMCPVGQAERRVFPLLLMFGEGLPGPPEPAAALAAALPVRSTALGLAHSSMHGLCCCYAAVCGGTAAATGHGMAWHGMAWHGMAKTADYI